MSVEELKELACEKCGCKEFEQTTRDFSSDNVVKFFRCKKCGHEMNRLIPIG